VSPIVSGSPSHDEQAARFEQHIDTEPAFFRREDHDACGTEAERQDGFTKARFAVDMR
jgi:hypothetical protein